MRVLQRRDDERPLAEPSATGVVRDGFRRFEGIAVVVVVAAATLYAEYRILSRPLSFQGDAALHTFWMRRFQDPSLFRDPLTNALLRTGYIPPGVRFVYWMASHVVDPITFGEWLPLLLVPLSAWLLFRIVRIHTEWKPAAWLAVGLFLFPWDIHRFSGGHARAFGQPIILLTVWLALRKRDILAAAVPVLGALFYPPGALVALGAFGLSSLQWNGRPAIEVRRFILAAGGAVLVAAAILGPGVIGNTSTQILSKAAAMKYPEFGPGGQHAMFGSSLRGTLTNNYTGFHFQQSGSIVVVAGLLLLLLRSRNARLVRKELWAMALSSLLLFGLANALLFRLYLPTRYTYALLPFFAAVAGVAWRPTWEMLAGDTAPRFFRAALVVLVPVAVGAVALMLFPLGPLLSPSELGSELRRTGGPFLIVVVAGLSLVAIWYLAGRLSAARRVAAVSVAGVVAGSLLVTQVAWAGGLRSRKLRCDDVLLYRYLQTVPKSSIIAADPLDSNCVVLAAERPVVMSTKLYQPWYVDYFRLTRQRMFDLIRASYGSSMQDIINLRSRYGADYLVVRKGRVTRQTPGDRWRNFEPFTTLVAQLLASERRPAVLDLPVRCQTWRSGGESVFDLACVARLEGARLPGPRSVAAPL